MLKKGEKYMKNMMLGTYIKGEETYNFNFATDLSAASKLKFVNSVIDVLVDDKSYNSIIHNLVFDFFVVNIFTDVDTKELLESSTFIKDVEQFLEETNIVDIVVANMKDGLYEELNKAVDLNIEYLTGIHTNPLNEALTSLINTLEKKVKEIDIDKAMEMANVFSGMTGEFTPESIVNAYMASDTHKKNMIELEESKKQRAEFAEIMDKAITSTDGSKKTKSKK